MLINHTGGNNSTSLDYNIIIDLAGFKTSNLVGIVRCLEHTNNAGYYYNYYNNCNCPLPRKLDLV